MKALRDFIYSMNDIIKERNIIWGLAKNDFKARFASSFLGGAWGVIQPLVNLLVMWFVFQAGFKSAPISGVPFIVWLAPAYLSWSFFSETLMSGTNCLIEYSYLVKKVNFRVILLPIIKIISAMFIHGMLIVFILFLMVCNHVTFSIYNFQFLYYWFCACVLLTGLCWILSSMAPFVKDVVNIVGVVVQIGFWLTPIFWVSDNMGPIVQRILKLNPMYYVCIGYRDSFIDHVWFWERGWINAIFWGIALLFLLTGARLFNKLRPQFADVL